MLQEPLPIRALIFARQLAASLLIVAAITFICSRIAAVNATTAGFAYLLGILAIGAAFGLIEAIIASVVAMLCFNFFFLPPVGQFTIADPQNWVALFAFLATSLVASHISDREKRQAREARTRQSETEQLYALSRFILLAHPAQSNRNRVSQYIVQHIAEVFKSPAVALYDAETGEIFRGGPEDVAPDVTTIDEKLRQVVILGSDIHEPDLIVTPIILGGHAIGALALRRLDLSDGALHALLNLVAIVMERVRTEEAVSRAEAARQNEEFKSTLLDALAHEFKTPLTSIKAASTSLLSDAAVNAHLRELAAIIDEETDRLSELVTEAVRMAQIDAGTVRLDRTPLQLSALVSRVLDQMKSRVDGRPIRVGVPPDLPAVVADPDLMALVLRQLLDNALKYSPPGSPIKISADSQGSRVILRVHDRGSGIPQRERERIFEKFYRWQTTSSHIPGTGLGLYIAREITRAHGGDVWVEGSPGEGSTFCVALPTADPA
jgi:two-component system, OmpR family, sensor histidine kinase KdpD